MMMMITNTSFSIRRFGNYRDIEWNVLPSLGSATRRYHPRHAVCTEVLLTADCAANVRVKPTRVIKRLASCSANEVDHMFINLNARRLAQSDLTVL